MKKSTKIKMRIGLKIFNMVCDVVVATVCLGLAVIVAVRG